MITRLEFKNSFKMNNVCSFEPRSWCAVDPQIVHQKIKLQKWLDY